ncbi:hypothetical protein E4631_05795 [Hymenobacter sp. UV11]|uniref:hypothetical protein n=1 Tax=Hymenobacter sp. UV11 TaxID=1849735 RepID=UPI00105D5A36|nr:hypothetical protein [Hymenobacter sp. UV11]TDN39936.1 hypothetical protein A8B98_16305 [Hymenobacter sp. UV11]TFZ67493.1 hypothetical protein E4631_05795 [Hymenobacter sp. UV11]
MKSFLLLAAACALTASAALAQTTVPPGTVPGDQPVVTPDMTNAGSPRAPKRAAKVPGLDHHDQKRMRKMGHKAAKPPLPMKPTAN